VFFGEKRLNNGIWGLEDSRMSGTRKSNLLGKITVLFFICCFCLPAQAKYGGGTGEPNDPYLIYTAEQMNEIGLWVNWDDWYKCFKLMADIDLGGYTGEEFNIIGTDWNRPFTGVFDGNGHTISNFTYSSTEEDKIGLFGCVLGKIKDLGLINAEVDVGWGQNVGLLVGMNCGNITNCYAEGGSVSGYSGVGGLVGGNQGEYGTITYCYSTAGVSGGFHVGGLVGWNSEGTIANCYSTGSVLGESYVGGLVGSNDFLSTITNCCATGSVSGYYGVGGLVGLNHFSTITNCYSTGSVSGDNTVGGLVGGNHGIYQFPIWMQVSKIINCYSTGSVEGVENIGGLVGDRNSLGGVNYSFWDTETSGQTTSNSGTGLPTAQMQLMSTFTDAGWDFEGETLNGIEDIWFIGQGDYPHLWWEEMQVPMKLTPRTLNCRSYGNWVKAHLILPQGFTVEDVDSNRPAVLHSFGFESAPLYVFVNKDKRVQIEAAFERQAVCSLAGDWPQVLTVAGFLADGSIFLGTSTVRIIAPGMKEIEDLAWYWLNAGCEQPDFCDRIDMNRDSIVNLLDYALFMNSQVEFIRE
jgi:hypothetical protein